MYYYYLNLSVGLLPSSIVWTVPQGWSIIAGQGTTRATIQTGNTAGYVNVAATICGVTRTKSMYVNIGGGGPNPLFVSNNFFNIYPNPVSTNQEFSIAFASDSTAKIQAKSLYTKPSGEATKYKIVVFDNNMQKVIQTQSSGESVTLNTSRLINGLYYIRVTQGKKSETQQLLIQN
ncbi:hypothetical protein C3K47_19130 [Solitalea longa]|uniref:Uncharacterized protein n=1 Tax=Solitalea longa TaxID=2079460 RepID=A0A2S4ZXP9_9SPHI|nr:T9SS type A sorting domain-containing protein [Solitalea longa]POY34663.1 hypothetical protein C3K47_19130 [Solitalea longa]